MGPEEDDVHVDFDWIDGVDKMLNGLDSDDETTERNNATVIDGASIPSESALSLEHRGQKRETIGAEASTNAVVLAGGAIAVVAAASDEARSVSVLCNQAIRALLNYNGGVTVIITPHDACSLLIRCIKCRCMIASCVTAAILAVAPLTCRYRRR